MTVTLKDLKNIPRFKLPSEAPTSRFDRKSYSTVSAYLRCGYAHHLQFVERLLPINPQLYLTRGTLIHHGLEYALLAQFIGVRGQEVNRLCLEAIQEKFDEHVSNPLVAALCEEEPSVHEELNEILLVSASVANRAVDRGQLNTGRWRTLTTEQDGVLVPLIEFDIAVHILEPHDFWFHAKVDWAAEDTETGFSWTVDFKTRKALQSVEDDETNAQHGVYMQLLRHFGIDLNGSITWQIRAAVPKLPKLNKPTKKAPKAMARSAISSDWETYSQALCDNGLDPDDYLDMKDKLSVFDTQSRMFRGEQETKGMFTEFLTAATWLESGKLPVLRAMNTYNCKDCKYKDLCMERLRGKDIPMEEMGLFGLSTPSTRGEVTDKNAN